LLCLHGNSPEVISRDTKINPYVIRKSVVIARNLNIKILKKLIAELLIIDVRLKSETVDADDIIKNYLLKLGRQ
jgi:hypothetical protein